MPSTVSASPDAVDLGHVVRAVVRRLPLLALLAGLTGGATAAILSTMAPQYLSQTQLKIRGGATGDASSAPDKEAVGTHVRGLMATELALKMAKVLDLTKRPEFNAALEPEDLYGRTLRNFGVGGPKAGETDEDRLMQAYFKAIRAYQVRETRAIIVDCTTSNAKFSATCANTLAGLYRDSLRGRAVVENTDMRSKLAPEVERLTRETSQAEGQAAEFRGKANLFQGTVQATQLKDQQLSELSAELTKAATVRGEAEARALAAREMSNRGTAAANPDVQKSTLIPRMEEQRVTLERQISELSATLLAGHPRMKQLRSELAGLQGQIRAEVLKVVDSLGNDARIAVDREAGVRRRVEDMKKTVLSSAPDATRLSQLEAQAKAKRTELERVQRQYEVAASSAGAAVTPPEVEIVSEAYPSNEKVFPKVGSMAAMAAVASLLLGFAITLTRELVRGTRPAPVRATTAIATQDRAPPNLTETPARRLDIFSEIATAKSAARALITTADGTRGYRVIMTAATGAISGANSSANSGANSGAISGAQEASELAQQLAEAGSRVLLVAWAGSGDALARHIGGVSHPGTADLLAGAASLEDSIQSVAGRGFDFLPSGNAQKQVVDADSAAMVLDALDELYDTIVVLAPHAIARDLFESLQGRFDAGVLIATGTANPSPTVANAAFLGFSVPDLPVLTMASSAAPHAVTYPPAGIARTRIPRTGISA